MTDIENLIKESSFFDEEYYLKENREIKELEITPLKHYIDIGIKEDRKPNKDFDPIWYRDFYSDVKENGAIPIIHFILFGEKEGRFISEKEYSEYSNIKLKYEFKKELYLETLSKELQDNKSLDILLHYIRYSKDKKYIKEEIKTNIIKEKELDSKNNFTINYKEYKKYCKNFSICNNTKFYKENLIKFNIRDEYYFFNKIKHPDIKLKKLKEFDLDFYITYNEDLKKNNLKTYFEAMKHYIIFGSKENRAINFLNLLQLLGIDREGLERFIDKKFFKKVKEINDFEIDYEVLIKNFQGENSLFIKIDKENQKNADFYLLLAENFLIKNNFIVADKHINTSLYFKTTAKALEYKGNINFEHNNYDASILFYEKALNLDNQLKYVYSNLLQSYIKKDKISEFIELIKKAVKKAKLHSISSLLNLINKELIDFYNKEKTIYLNQFFVTKNRELLTKQTNKLVEKIYTTYYELYRGFDKKDKNNSINKEKILIIGDYHIEQCVRYRIDQKVEQLEAQDFEVETIDWLDIDKNSSKIPFYDIVIFYRVPSTPEIIRTIAQVNALNKISIYEIDDLLFEPIYPDSIESYGGSIGLDVYYGLIMGMAEFNSVAKLCDYGIASTIPLAKKLEKLVKKRKVFVHRNGLDSINFFEKSTLDKEYINIIYGSGTLAHNQDFIDLVLPALEKLMIEFKNIRLEIIGHLTLPKEFIKKFEKRVVKIPKVKITSYYSYLKEADINLAVLHKDEITDSKSELKWFEAGCFSIPSVMSATENYLDIINEGVDGFLASTPDEWYNKIKPLVKDKKLREKIGENTLNRIKKEYSIETLGEKLKTNILEIVKEHSPKEKRKKIALVNVFFPPQSIGGATRVVADNFEVLVEDYSKKYEIVVFTSEAEGVEPYQISSYNYMGVRVYKSSILFRENMDWHPKDKKMYSIFEDFLELEKPDIVHFHCVQRLTASIIEATKDNKIPYIVTVHDAWWISDFQFLVDDNQKVYKEGHPDPFEKKSLPNNITLDESLERGFYLKSLLKNAKDVLTVSEAFANIYRKNGITNIKVTKNGISDRIKWQPKETNYTEKVVCGHIGGMSSHKGYDILKEAVLELEPKNIEFLIADHSKDESYISKEKWESVDITFIGRQKQEEMVSLYKKIDILFAPSIWPESFGLVTREANACGCFVVASNLGGIGEDIENKVNGFKIEPTKKELIKVIKTVDENYKKYKEIAPKGNISKVSEQVKELTKYLN